MNQNLINDLDRALDQLRDGVKQSSILAQFPSRSDDLRPLLETAEALELIRPVELPSPERQRLDRSRFLASIAQAEKNSVSIPLLVRLQEQITIWFNQNLAQPVKENNKMSLMMFRIGLIFSMLIAMAGGTVAMASNSLPDSPLYPAKMLVEQINLNMQADPAERAALHLVMAQERVREVVRLAENGDVPGEPLMFRLEEHLNTALQLGAQLEDPGMAGFLNQARQMLQTQIRELTRIRTHTGGPLDEPLQQTVRLLERVRQQVEYGMQNPTGFRSRVRAGQMDLPPDPCVDAPSTPGCEPAGEQHQYGPQPIQPGPGGPGGNPDCPSNDCEPVGDQHRYGPQPEQPGPGSPGGNPDCPSNDCEPAGDQHQYGPQPEQPGPGGPGGNPDCPSNDCEPVGDQHQNGPQPNDPGPGDSGNPDPGGSNGSGGSGGSENPGGSGGSGGRP